MFELPTQPMTQENNKRPTLQDHQVLSIGDPTHRRVILLAGYTFSNDSHRHRHQLHLYSPASGSADDTVSILENV